MCWDPFTLVQPAIELSRGLARRAWSLFAKDRRGKTERSQLLKSGSDVAASATAASCNWGKRSSDGWNCQELPFLDQLSLSQWQQQSHSCRAECGEERKPLSCMGFLLHTLLFSAFGEKRWCTKASRGTGFWLSGSSLDHSAVGSIYVQSCLSLKFKL